MKVTRRTSTIFTLELTEDEMARLKAAVRPYEDDAFIPINNAIVGGTSYIARDYYTGDSIRLGEIVETEL